jgi:hypothetical protein
VRNGEWGMGNAECGMRSGTLQRSAQVSGLAETYDRQVSWTVDSLGDSVRPYGRDWCGVGDPRTACGMGSGRL